MEALGETKDAAIHNNIACGIHVTGGSQKLKQMIWNVGDNAIKYTPAGGRVTITLGWERATAVIEVSDTGIGIPGPDLPHVFDRFYRVASVGLKTTGTGLGLAIAKRIAEVHDGQISVESTLGQGARFRITLPHAERIQAGRNKPH